MRNKIAYVLTVGFGAEDKAPIQLALDEVFKLEPARVIMPLLIRNFAICYAASVLAFRSRTAPCQGSKAESKPEVEGCWADYCAWCEQNGQPACRRELFCETMNQSFTREDGGWQGVALAIDLLESKYVM